LQEAGQLAHRRIWDDLLHELFQHHDVRYIFAAGFRWLMNHREYVLPYPHVDAEIHNHPACIQVQEIATRHLVNVRGLNRTARRDPLLLNYANGAALRTDISRLFTGKSDDDLAPLFLPIAVGLLNAIDLLYDADIRAAHVAEAAPHLFETVNDVVVTKPLPALGYARSSTAYPPAATVPAEYMIIDAMFLNLTVPPWPPDADGLRPALYAPPGILALRQLPREQIKIGLASIFSGFDNVDWQHDDAEFWGRKVAAHHQAAVRKRLEWVFNEATRHSLDLLIFPELNLDEELEEHLITSWARARRLPRPTVVIGGRLHRLVAGTTRYRNQPLVLTQDGILDWPYWKNAPTLYTFDDGKERAEALAHDGRYVVALDTPVGRLCIVICLDALHKTTVRAIAALRASVVIIPSMTSASSIEKFRTTARELAETSHAITIFCNSSIHLRKSDDAMREALGFVHSNVRHGARKLPTHRLPGSMAQAVLALYTQELRPTAALPQVAVLFTTDGDTTQDGTTMATESS
jgi:Carbon-nitrogen hydrolase